MNFKDMTLGEFTGSLASRAAVPGGGGASALAGALGAALGAMVGNLTVGKARYAAVWEEMEGLTAEAAALSQRLLALAEEDADAFEPLSRAYSIPKDDPGRGEIMEKCLAQAAQTPLEILRCCCQAIELQESFAQKGSVMAVSDAATGAALCQGAMYGAAVNVKVNTKLMGDRARADGIDREVDSLLAEYRQRAEKIYGDIYGRYC